MNEACIKVFDKYMDVLESTLSKYNISEEDITTVVYSVGDCIEEAYYFGKGVFLYHIAEMQRKTFDLETGKEDFYWSIGAGFNDREEAENYIAKQKENSPEKTYCIFEGGIIPGQIF